MTEKTPCTRPFFMWAGGKTRLLRRYDSLWPRHDFDTYVEPFLGGGAVFSWIHNRPDHHVYGHAMLNDVNAEVMSVYGAVRDDAPGFIEHTQSIATPLLRIPVEDRANRRAFYYDLRRRYWDQPDVYTLYVLMRLGFNGIWQTCEASHGLFGTPAGLLRQTDMGQIVDGNLITAWSGLLRGADLSARDYGDLEFNPKGSLVYLDPPYRGSFTTYGTVFDDAEQRRLCSWALGLADAGATVLLANRDSGDGFFEGILGDRADIHYFDVVYTAGRRKRTETGFEAKPAREFLAVIHR